MTRRAFLTWSALSSFALITGACSSNPRGSDDGITGPRPERTLPLEALPRSLTVEAGRSVQLRAEALDPWHGGTRVVPVEWQSLDPAIATVDAAGIATFAPDAAHREVVFVGRRLGASTTVRARVVPPSPAAAAARALAAAMGDARVALLLDVGTGIIADDEGRVYQWQDARGPGYPSVLSIGAPPVIGRTPDGAPSVRFNGVDQGMRSDARFEMDSTNQAPSLLYVGTSWGDGVPLILGDVGSQSLGLTLVPHHERPWGGDGLVAATASGAETHVANGPGDRQKSTRVRIHTATQRLQWIYGTSPVVGFSPATTAVARDRAPLWVGRSPTGDFDADDVCMLLVMHDWPSTADLAAVGSWARERYASVFGASRLVVFAGDSLTNGLDLPDARYSYPNQLMERPSLRGWDDANVARGGTGVYQQLVTVQQDVDALYDPARERNDVIVMTGTNDLALLERTGQQAYEDTRSWCQGRRDRGWRVTVLSMLSRRAGPSFERERQAYLSLLRADHSFADAFVDVAADPRLGAPDACNDTAWFHDGVHPTVDGYRLIADMVEPVLLAR